MTALFLSLKLLHHRHDHQHHGHQPSRTFKHTLAILSICLIYDWPATMMPPTPSTTHHQPPALPHCHPKLSSKATHTPTHHLSTMTLPASLSFKFKHLATCCSRHSTALFHHQPPLKQLKQSNSPSHTTISAQHHQHTKAIKKNSIQASLWSYLLHSPAMNPSTTHHQHPAPPQIPNDKAKHSHHSHDHTQAHLSMMTIPAST